METYLNFATAIIAHLKNDPSMASTVTAWLRTEPDSNKREVEFALQLRADLESEFQFGKDGGNGEFIDVIIRMAWQRTSWRSVARALIRYYKIPVTLAAIVGRPANSRLTKQLAGFRGRYSLN